MMSVHLTRTKVSVQIVENPINHRLIVPELAYNHVSTEKKK